MVTFLPTPIGNLQDITLRTLETLQQCEVLLCEDTRISRKLIALLTERNLLPAKDYQYFAFHTHNQSQFLKQMTLDFFNQNIGFLSDAGMPCISDPGVELVRFLQSRHLPYEVLGGISAVTLAVAFSGIIEKEFSFLGFLPHKVKERFQALQQAFKSLYPIVFYESPHRLLETLELMAQIDSQREVFLAKELTKKHQQTFKGTLTQIKESFLQNYAQDSTFLKGEWVIVLEKAPQNPEEKVLTQEMLLSLEIPPKIKAKILAKLKGGNASEYYARLIK